MAPPINGRDGKDIESTMMIGYARVSTQAQSLPMKNRKCTSQKSGIMAEQYSDASARIFRNARLGTFVI
jgi:hypothetical protein